MQLLLEESPYLSVLLSLFTESVQKSLENHFTDQSIPIQPSDAFMSRIAVSRI